MWEDAFLLVGKGRKCCIFILSPSAPIRLGIPHGLNGTYAPAEGKWKEIRGLFDNRRLCLNLGRSEGGGEAKGGE